MSTMKPVSEADVAVTTIRMLPLSTPDVLPVNVDPMNVEEVELEEQYISCDIDEDPDINEDINEEGITI